MTQIYKNGYGEDAGDEEDGDEDRGNTGNAGITDDTLEDHYRKLHTTEAGELETGVQDPL